MPSPFHMQGLHHPASVHKWGMQSTAQRYAPLPWLHSPEQHSECNDHCHHHFCPSLPVQTGWGEGGTPIWAWIRRGAHTEENGRGCEDGCDVTGTPPSFCMQGCHANALRGLPLPSPFSPTPCASLGLLQSDYTTYADTSDCLVFFHPNSFHCSPCTIRSGDLSVVFHVRYDLEASTVILCTISISEQHIL